MPLEVATYINQLNPANPVGSDPLAQADDHLRLLKTTIKNTFPNIDGAVTVTDDVLNALPGRVTALETNGVGGSGGTTASGSTLPASGSEVGELFFNTTNNILYVWNGTAWVPVESAAQTPDAPEAVEVVSSLPSTAPDGKVVFNTNDNKLYERVNGAWVEVVITVNAAQEVADASITVAKFAQGIRPIEIVSTLPTTGNSEGRMVYLTTDDKIYRFTGAAFTASMPFGDLTGTIAANQIAANTLTAGMIQAGAIGASQIAAGAVSTAKLAAGAITADKIAATAITADKIATNAITSDKISANAITAGKIAAAAIGTTQLAASAITSDKIAASAITSDKIAASGITADKITSGNASVVAGGTFSLGGGQSLNGYSAVVSGSTTLATGFGSAGYLNSTTAVGWSGALGATVSGTGYGGAFYNATDTLYNSFRTTAGLAFGTSAGQFRYNRNIGTADNMSLLPVSNVDIATSENAGYFAYTGPDAPARLYETFLANSVTGSAVVGRRYNTAAAIETECYLATTTYSFYGSVGKAYAAAGWAPFTGVHDGLINVNSDLQQGDIVVDDVVLARLDISNSVVKFVRSTTANQKGVIGVFVESFDEPPIDWLPAAELKGADKHPWQMEMPTEGSPISNPSAYPIPSGMKVAHVNALGEGLINVCGENGDIDKGDLIVTSSIPGKGMKQSDDIVRSYTVAKAREAVTFDSPDQVKQIACIYVCG